MTALRAEGVFKVFGRRPQEAVKRLRDGASREEIKNLGTAAVIDTSFEVTPGETFVVMGLSGSGKSTLIRMLNGLVRPTAGKILLGDADLSQVSASELREIRQRKVSMVFQHFALLPHRSVLDNAAYPLEIQGIDRTERRRRAATSLGLVGLDGWEDSLPSQLSGGMRQRVGLARALAADTDVLLMDEAFSALDPLIRGEMQEQLLELQQTLGKTIIFITHDLNEAMHLGDRIAMMRDGRIVQIGTSEQILSEPADEYVATFVADVDRTRVLTAGSVMVRAKAVVTASGGPHVALRQMKESQTSAAYVIDHDRKLLGVVRDSDVVAAVRAGGGALVDLTLDEVSPVAEDALLAELFAPAAETPLPVPVIDSRGRLVGVIPRVTLLEAMTPNTAEPAPDASSTTEPSIAEPAADDLDVDELDLTTSGDAR